VAELDESGGGRATDAAGAEDEVVGHECSFAFL
jgi:hypothetical protein